jgi:hypothetical protein
MQHTPARGVEDKVEGCREGEESDKVEGFVRVWWCVDGGGREGRVW